MMMMMMMIMMMMVVIMMMVVMMIMIKVVVVMMIMMVMTMTHVACIIIDYSKSIEDSSIPWAVSQAVCSASMLRSFDPPPTH